MNKSLNITTLHVSNFLGISDGIYQFGKLNIIEGKNGVGKTSVIKAIQNAIGGGRDARLIHNGETKAETVIILDDDTNITKTITEKRGVVKVYPGGSNTEKSSAQKFLNEMANKNGKATPINPLDLILAKPEEIVDLVMKHSDLHMTQEQLEDAVAGATIDDDPVTVPDATKGNALSIIDNLDTIIRDSRKGVNAIIREKTQGNEELKDSLLELMVDPDQITGELDKYRSGRDGMLANKQELIKSESDSKDKLLEANRAKYRDQLEELQRVFDARKKDIIVEESEEKDKIVDYHNKALADIETRFAEKYDPVVERITALETDQRHVGAFTKQQEMIAHNKREILDKEREAKGQTNALNGLKDLKTTLQGQLPIAGLSIKDKTLFVDDIPFHNINTAKQIQLAIKISILALGDLKIILVDGLERLDKEQTEIFIEEALKVEGVQYIATKVTDEGSVKHTAYNQTPSL